MGVGEYNESRKNKVRISGRMTRKWERRFEKGLSAYAPLMYDW